MIEPAIAAHERGAPNGGTSHVYSLVGTLFRWVAVLREREGGARLPAGSIAERGGVATAASAGARVSGGGGRGGRPNELGHRVGRPLVERRTTAPIRASAICAPSPIGSSRP